MPAQRGLFTAIRNVTCEVSLVVIFVLLPTASKLAEADQPADSGQKPPSPMKIERLTSDGAYKHRPVWLADGKRILFGRHEEGGNAIRLRISSGAGDAMPRRLTQRKDPEYDAAISPDGTQVLFTAITLSGTQGNLDIVLMPLDGQAEPKVVAGDVNGQLSHQDWPAWLPDGKRFVFNSTHEGNQEIYLGYADGSKPPERLTQSPGQDVHPVAMPDGKSLIFATDRWGGLELARLKIDDKSVVRLTESPGFDDYPSLSPDGKSLVFVSNRSGNPDLWLIDEKGRTTRLTDSPEPDLFPAFSREGESIIFVSGQHGETDLYRVALPR